MARSRPTPLRLVMAVMLGLVLASCSATGLAPGLTARLDHPGATINRADALAIINDYRRSAGLGPLIADPSLDAVAQDLAQQYARNGRQPPKPQGAIDVRYSAGYPTFAEVFSGWRNSEADARVLATQGATRAGIGGFYTENSPFGAYWALVLG
jgi:uncharacterized protein YkwD